MPAPPARVDYGTFTASDAVNEPNLLVQTVTATSSKEEKWWKDITSDADVLGRASNRGLGYAIKAYVKTVAGFVTQAIGTTVASLQNFATAHRGFDPASGIMIFDEPVDTFNIGDLRQCDFTVKHKPYVV
jgi:hypothetical protein